MIGTRKVNDRVIVDPENFGRWGGRVVRDNEDGTYAIAPLVGEADASCARIDAGRLQHWPDTPETPHKII